MFGIIGYIDAVKRQFIDTYGFPENPNQPGCVLGDVPDGSYPKSVAVISKTIPSNMANENPTLRAQACRFRRYTDRNAKVATWEPGIAFVKSFDISDVDFIVDAAGKVIPRNKLYNYELLKLRTDGYIAIEPGDYAGKRYSPKEDTPRGDPAHDYR